MNENAQNNKNPATLFTDDGLEIHLRMPICLRLLLSRFRPGVRDTRHAAVYFAVGFAVTALILAIAVQLPQAPYNLREIFGEKSLWVGLPALSAFLLWSAGTPNLAARLTIICPMLHLLQPLLFLLLAGPAWLMLRFAVSGESLIDVFGDPVLGWPGDWELFVRFLGHSAPFFLTLLYWNLLFEGSAWVSRWFGLGQMVAAFLVGLPLLWLCKQIVVDYAATDRVLLLSAQGPSWMIGGVLVLAMSLVTMNGVIVGWMSVWPARRWLSVAILTPLLFIVSWRLISIGLSQEGILLLFGVPQIEQADKIGLMLRWLLVYAAAITVIACAHLIPFRLRGSPMSQRQAYVESKLHLAVNAGERR